MIQLNPETVNFIIDKSREFQTKDSVNIPEPPEDRSGSWAEQALGSYAEDFTYQELSSTITDLEPDQQICLVALMWLGRGDYDIDEWDAALTQAEELHNERTADYLIATPLLSDYLEEGLVLHGYEPE